VACDHLPKFWPGNPRILNTAKKSYCTRSASDLSIESSIQIFWRHLHSFQLGMSTGLSKLPSAPACFRIWIAPYRWHSWTWRYLTSAVRIDWALCSGWVGRGNLGTYRCPFVTNLRYKCGSTADCMPGIPQAGRRLECIRCSWSTDLGYSLPTLVSDACPTWRLIWKQTLSYSWVAHSGRTASFVPTWTRPYFQFPFFKIIW